MLCSSPEDCLPVTPSILNEVLKYLNKEAGSASLQKPEVLRLPAETEKRSRSSGSYLFRSKKEDPTSGLIEKRSSLYSGLNRRGSYLFRTKKDIMGRYQRGDYLFRTRKFEKPPNRSYLFRTRK